jgi:hypothetical protein
MMLYYFSAAYDVYIHDPQQTLRFDNNSIVDVYITNSCINTKEILEEQVILILVEKVNLILVRKEKQLQS